MSKRVCVFVDGENFRHSIVKLFDGFHQNEYLPKKANWESLFEWIVSQSVESGERIRTYWYVIQMLDFWPYKFPDDDVDLQKVLCKDKSTKNILGQINDASQRSRKASQLRNELQERQDSMNKRFDGWRRIQDGIAFKSPRIEFRRAGAITYNTFKKNLGSEKAVDVKLATDLILLRDIYDEALIVSGDQDYVPAVQAVKDSGKIVSNVVFKARNGRLLPGGANRLNQLTDHTIELRYDELKEHLNL